MKQNKISLRESILSKEDEDVVQSILDEVFQDDKFPTDLITISKSIMGAMRNIFIHQLKKHNDWYITILYHDDIDGNGSGYAIHTMIHTMIDQFCKYTRSYEGKAFKEKEFRDHIKIVYRRIGYNTDLSEIYLDNDNTIPLEKSKMIFIVDFSIQKGPQYNFLTDFMKHYIGDLFWIDHHATSGMILSLPNDLLTNDLIGTDNILYYTKVGVSATLLCWMVSVLAISKFASYLEILDDVYSRNDLHTTIKLNLPDIIIMISLYDTFHPIQNIDFYYGINTFEYDLQSLNDKIDHIWGRLMMTGTYDYITIKDAILNIMPSTYKEESYDNLIDLIKTGHSIRLYEEHSYTITKRAQEFPVCITLDGETYNLVAINRMGNSFMFMDSYYIYDGVIMFYYNKSGTYNYSIYSDLNNSNHINCRKVAEVFGGGGHEGAAGFRYKSNIFEGDDPLILEEVNSYKKVIITILKPESK